MDCARRGVREAETEWPGFDVTDVSNLEVDQPRKDLVLPVLRV